MEKPATVYISQPIKIQTPGKFQWLVDRMTRIGRQ